MRVRSIVVALAVCLVTAAVCMAADDPFLGTWKLNEAKSKIGNGPKNTTVVYAAAGDSVKITTDGTDAKGSPAHSEWTGKFDGKDYPVSGDPSADARAYKKVGARTLTFENKKDGKATLTGRITISADGKTRTVHLSGTGPDGKPVSSTNVYDKQ
jgi:hypothetical protein